MMWLGFWVNIFILTLDVIRGSGYLLTMLWLWEPVHETGVDTLLCSRYSRRGGGPLMPLKCVVEIRTNEYSSRFATFTNGKRIAKQLTTVRVTSLSVATLRLTEH